MRSPLYEHPKITYHGMTCDHCARTVEDALNALPGVKARVSYSQRIAEIQAPKDLSTEQLLQVVKAKGFDANLLEGQP